MTTRSPTFPTSSSFSTSATLSRGPAGLPFSKTSSTAPGSVTYKVGDRVTYEAEGFSNWVGVVTYVSDDGTLRVLWGNGGVDYPVGWQSMRHVFPDPRGSVIGVPVTWDERRNGVLVRILGRVVAVDFDHFSIFSDDGYTFGMTFESARHLNLSGLV